MTSRKSVKFDLSRSLAALRPGGTLAIPAGTYHGKIVIPCDNVTVCAAAPGVVVDGSVKVNGAVLKPSGRRRNVYAWKLPRGSSTGTPWIFRNGHILLRRNRPLVERGDAMCFFIDTETRVIEINTGNPVDRNDCFTVPVLGPLVDLGGKRRVRVRGLCLMNSAETCIEAGGSEACTVEYCQIYRAGGMGIRGGRKAQYARNTIVLCNDSGLWQGKDNDQSLIEENLLVANQVNWTGDELWAGNLKQNDASHCIFRQNWVMDHTPGPVKVGKRKHAFKHFFATGIWADINCNSNTYEGNAIARLPHAGIYIEHTSYRNVAAFNCIQDCAMGITLRQASQNLVTKNWIFNREFFGEEKNDTRRYAAFGRGVDTGGSAVTKAQERAMWGRQLFDGICLWHAFDDFQEASRENSFHHNLVQVSGRAVSVPMGPHGWPGKRKRNREDTTVTTNSIDRNYYGTDKAEGGFSLLGKKTCRGFEKHCRASGWDIHSRVGRFTVSVLGLEPIWTIPWAATRPGVPVAILHDPSFQTRSALSIHEPMFWHSSHPQADWIDTPPQARWERNGTGGHRGRGYIFLESTLRHRGRWFSDIVSWTSAPIPVMPGVAVKVGMWMKAHKVKPARRHGGAAVSVLFHDACGFVVDEEVMVGLRVRKRLMKGSYGWTEIAACRAVPARACWMSVAMRLTPSTGRVFFDDVHMGLQRPCFNMPQDMPTVTNTNSGNNDCV